MERLVSVLPWYRIDILIVFRWNAHPSFPLKPLQTRGPTQYTRVTVEKREFYLLWFVVLC